MFKFLADIKELKRDVKEIFDEFNEDYAFTGFFSRRRTLRKRVDDLEDIVDKLLGHLNVEANQIAETPDEIIPGTPEHWTIAPAGTRAKERAEANGEVIKVPSVTVRVTKGRKTTKAKKTK